MSPITCIIIGFSTGGPVSIVLNITISAPEIPLQLIEQLNDPGRLVIPVGDRTDQELRVMCKRNGRIDYRVATQCRFVPLRGGEGWQ